MRFILLMIPKVYQNADVDAKRMPSAEDVDTMTRFNEEMAGAGILRELDGFMPPAAGARIVFPGGKAQLEAAQAWPMGNVVGGYWMINVGSKEEAIAWARRVPALDGDTIEVRQVFEMQDFPEDVQAAAASSMVTEAVAGS